MKVSASYQQWREANPQGSFSWFDFAHCVMRDGEIGGDLAIALARLIWPEFIEIDSLVFLAEQYSEDRASSLRNQAIVGHHLEYWMNLFSVDGFFSGVDGTPEETQEHLAKILVDAWRAKLTTDFPSRKFVVEIVRDDDVGDLCVVFMQGVGGAESSA